MKKTTILIFLLTAFIAVTFTGCPQPDDPPKTYAINLQWDEGGTAIASPNPVERGKLVTLSASPAKGYKFKAWQVISGGVMLSDINVNDATFIMPANETTVKVEFESIADVMLDELVYGTEEPVKKSIALNTLVVDPLTVTSIRLGGGENSPFALDETDINNKITVWARTDIKTGEWTDTVTVAYGGKTVTFDIGIVVTPKPVTITGITAQDKVYDGTVSVIFEGTAALAGIVAGDDITLIEGEAFFDDKNAGEGKTVILDGYGLEGEDAYNYTFVQPEEMTADITPKPVRVTVTVPPSRILVPFGMEDVLIQGQGYHRQHDTVSLEISGLVSGDTVTVGVGENEYGLSGSADIGKEGDLLISYDGTGVYTADIKNDAPLVVSGNYSLSNSSVFNVRIKDGLHEDRWLPVAQANIAEFNNYADTAAGAERHYKMIEGITLALPPDGGNNWTAIGVSDRQFTGSFDGGGYAIENLIVNNSSSYQGMFGFVGAGGVLKNIALAGGGITGGVNVGGIAGQNNGTIENSYTAGNVSGISNVGGIAGQNLNIIKNCYSAGDITSSSNNAGGITGLMPAGSVQYCYALGSVTGASNAGGIAGSTAYNSMLEYCVALNFIVASQGNAMSVDRVIGDAGSTGTRKNNYARDDMSVKYNWDGNTGTDQPLNIGHSNFSGENAFAGHYLEKNWWATNGYSNNWDNSPWDFTEIWDMNVFGLPKLKNASGIQEYKITRNVILIEMVQINSGSFTQGYTDYVPSPQYIINEIQTRTVTLNSFLMGKYEVTMEQYVKITGFNPIDYNQLVDALVKNHPVERVSWYDALAFCNYLSLMSGYEPVYTINGTSVTADWNNNGYRLPTEAEWEYACRAGTATGFSNGANFNTSNLGWHNIDNIAWYSANSGGYSQEVGGKYANPWGLHDMHGNVWEWCWDWYADIYQEGTVSNPRGPNNGTNRVIRGGYFGTSDPLYMRSSARDSNWPTQTQRPGVGFRVVRSMK